MLSTETRRFKPTSSLSGNFWLKLGIEDATTARAEAVHQGFKPLVYRNILQSTHLSQQEFQQITHIPLSTIKRRLKNDERFNTQESDVMYRLALLLKLASELFQSETRALDWMKQPVYGLAGKRPIDMVATTVDFEQVKDLIGRVEHGIFS